MVPAAPALPAYPDYGVAPPEPPSEGIQLGRVAAALKRFRWLILLITMLGTGAGILVTRFLDPEYTVQATIWVESPPQRNGPVVAEGLLQSYAWVELLNTYTVLDSVVAKERLYLSRPPEDSVAFRSFALAESFRPGAYVLQVDHGGRSYTLKTEDGLVVGTGKTGEPIGQRVGFAWTPSAGDLRHGAKIKFAVSTPRDASNSLGRNLKAMMAQDGNFLRLQLVGSDPVRLTRTLNAVTQQFVNVAADLKRRKLTEQSKILKEQVDTVGLQLRDAESRLERFRYATIAKPNDQMPITPGLMTTTPTFIGSYFGQKVQIEELKRDRENLERILAAAKSSNLSVDALATLPAVRQAPELGKALGDLTAAQGELQALKLKYTDDFKLVRDAQERVNTLRTQVVPGIAGNLINVLKAQQADLQSRVTKQTGELQQIPERSITEARLNNDVGATRALFNDLQARFQTAKLAEASATPDVRILDEAVPPDRPSSDSAPKIIFMAFAASMGFALALALLLDRLDKRFRYPDQVTNELGLSIFGAIPAMRRLKDGREDVEEAAQVEEAFRTIRLNLVHSYGAAGPVLLTVSSPGPGDGKSLVSSNLALSFAKAGYRTLLVDGDIRRGEQHRLFSCERVPGLLDFLMRSASLDEILRPTMDKNLMLIPCGTRRHHGPELLGSPAMGELMAQLKNRFNVIIVDSPPLGAGIDPFVLGTATGNMVVVLRSGETNRQMAEAKLRLLDRLPIRVLGAVLNDIRAGGVYQYYSYVYGYVADEEKGGQLPAASRGSEASPEA
jgi:capsular exopolysaccharide synthesis family protein